ncbi:MAG: hypothetical protein EXR71_01630 [Myxococcales bacterium]|nr:hypothetical protein [Myxococcales bacterium]
MSSIPILLLHLSAGCSEAYPEPPDAPSDDGALDTAAGHADTATDDTAPVEDPAPSPCTSYGDPAQTGIVGDVALDELSGLAVSWKNPDVLWVMEDHAGENAVYGLDAAGNTLARIELTAVVNNDWEDLAVGPCGDDVCIFVGDIGDNSRDRAWHGVLRFPEPQLTGAGDETLSVTPEVFPYVYPDGAWDSESMAILPTGMPVLFSKEYDTAQSTAYSFGALDASSTATLDRRGRFATGAEDETGSAAATSADLWPDGTRFVMRTYGHVWEYTLTPGGLDDLANAARTELSTGEERQGEAVGYDPGRPGFVTVSEGLNPPLYRVGCAE